MPEVLSWQVLVSSKQSREHQTDTLLHSLSLVAVGLPVDYERGFN